MILKKCLLVETILHFRYFFKYCRETLPKCNKLIHFFWKTYIYTHITTKMSLIQNPEQTFRWGRVQYLMDKTTDKKLLLALMGGRATYCCYDWPYWTRSKQKAFTDWLEYMEKCIEMANKYSENVSWDDDEDDGNFVEPTEFEEFTYYGTKFWKNTDGKGQWFYEHVDPGGDFPFVQVGEELGIYTSDTELEFSDGEGKNAGDYVPVLHWCGVIGEKMFLNDNLHPVAELIKQLQIRPTADSRAHEIISHRAKYGNAPLFENNIVFGNFFSREQFAEEVPAGASDYFDEFQEHIHRLGREGHFNELMKEYFEEWLETNQ